MSETLTDGQIQTVIGRYEELQDDLSHRIEAVRKEIENMDVNIYQYSVWGSRRVSETPAFSPDRDRVEKTVENLEEEKARYLRELSACLERLEEEHQRNWCIHLCYESLPHGEYTVLNKLYEEQVPWRAIQDATHMTMTRVRSLRLSGLKKIRESCGRRSS